MVYPSFQRRIKCTRIDSGIKSKKSDKGLLTKPDKYINICLNYSVTNELVGHMTLNVFKGRQAISVSLGKRSKESCFH